MTPKCLFFLLVFLSAGCGHQTTQPVAPFLQQEVNGVQIGARFVPAVGALPYPTSVSTERHSNSSPDYLYFNIHIQRPDFDPDEKSRNYLDFMMQQDFSLLDGPDTLQAAIAQRIVNGKKDQYEYLVAFRLTDQSTQANEQIQILYEDKIFGLGKQVFSFKRQELLAQTNKTN